MKKMEKVFKLVSALGLIIALAACGSTPQPTVALATNAFAKPGLKVGMVYIQPEEQATTHIFGADCLLCYGVASSMTSKLDTHLENVVDVSELVNIKQVVINEYGSRNISVEEITLEKPIDKLKKFKGHQLGFAEKDFRGLKESLGLDVLVVLQLDRHGAFRSFSSYVPNGDPQGHIAGTLFAVDLNTNSLLQYMEIDEKVQPTGDWDEPPVFPGVTTAYYQAVENVKSKLREAI